MADRDQIICGVACVERGFHPVQSVCVYLGFVAAVAVLLTTSQPSSHDGSTAVAIAAIAAAATTVYVVLTGWLAWETRKLRLSAVQPHVGVSVLPSEWASTGFADLVIRNDGVGPAINVRFIPEEATPGVANAELLGELRRLGIVQNGIPYLAPGSEFRLYFAQLVGRGDAQLRTNIHLRVIYESIDHRTFEPCYPLELGHFAKRMRIGHPPLPEIADEMKRLRNVVEQILSVIGGDQ